MAKSTHVPKQLHGYSLQFIECLRTLLTAGSNEAVSVEVLDDVALHAEGGKATLIQTKAGSGANPISDGSVELWKTLRNWIDQTNSGEIDPKGTLFTLYVGSPKKGKLCTAMNTAQSSHDVAQAIGMIEFKFLDKSKKKYRAGLGPDIREQLDVVLSTKNRKTLERIISRFEYRHGSGDSYVDLHERFSRMAIQPTLIEMVMDQMAGWVKRRIDTSIENGKTPLIHAKDFHHELASFHKKLINQPFLERLGHERMPGSREDHTSRNYYRQLVLIEADESELMEAITDYLSAHAHAVIYIRQGTINETSLKEYAQALRSLWAKLKKKWELQGGTKDDIHFGKCLLNDCSLQRTTMQGGDVPPAFMCGSFHQLADGLEIGWHPHYFDLLGGKNASL